MTFKDKTFCASPNCDGSCGRRMTSQERSQLNGLKKMHGKDYIVSYGYFCGEPQDDKMVDLSPLKTQV